MYSYLMRPARNGAHFCQKITVVPANKFVISNGLVSLSFLRDVSFHSAVGTGYRRIYDTRSFALVFAAAKRKIFSLCLTRKPAVGKRIFCNGHKSRSISVESVDGTVDKISPDFCKAVDKASAVMVFDRYHRKRRGLVYDGYVLVFVDDFYILVIHGNMRDLAVLEIYAKLISLMYLINKQQRILDAVL